MTRLPQVLLEHTRLCQYTVQQLSSLKLLLNVRQYACLFDKRKELGCQPLRKDWSGFGWVN